MSVKSHKIAEQNPPTGKQRELLRRDEYFLETARRIFLEEGYHALTMNRLAEITRFSRPTLYDRFGSKEGLLLEMGIRCQEELFRLVHRAANFPGRPRERMLAVGEAIRSYSRRYGDNMRIVAIISDEALAEKISPEQHARMRQLDRDGFNLLVRIVRDAETDGSLSLPDTVRPESLCLALWAVIDGCGAAMRGSAPLDFIGVTDPLYEVQESIQRMFDGYGWRPLTSEWDYDETLRRVKRYLQQEETQEGA